MSSENAERPPAAEFGGPHSNPRVEIDNATIPRNRKGKRLLSVLGRGLDLAVDVAITESVIEP